VVLPLDRDDDLVFTRADVEPLDPDGLSGTFERLSREAGLPKISFHDLRHAVASLMLAEGAPAKVVQEKLGHSSVTVTLDVYSHVAPGMQRAWPTRWSPPSTADSAFLAVPVPDVAEGIVGGQRIRRQPVRCAPPG
jgi:integrase